MKQTLYFLFLVFLVACDNELNVVEDFKDIPVVYGILSPSDTAQYIRVERAFIDESTSAIELAQNIDSIYYANASVEIQLQNGDVYTLNRVDANLEGYPREEGVFAQSPNYLYKIATKDIQLNPGETYQLMITRSESLPIVEASTNLVGSSQITTPSSSIGFAYVQPTKVRWRPGVNAKVYNINLEFNYRERVISSSSGFENKTLIWPMTTNFDVTGDDIENFEIPGIEFYSYLAGNLVADPDIERRFNDISLIMIGGGLEIQEINRLNDANLGITSSQDIPSYSNLSEGRGIFSSKYIENKTGLVLKSSSMDSLVNGIVTRDLNFKS